VLLFQFSMKPVGYELRISRPTAGMPKSYDYTQNLEGKLMSSFHSKWMDVAPETPKEQSARSAKSPSGTSGTPLPGGFPKNNAAQGERTWQDFYPDLAPADFEIEELASGISGRRVKGNVAGTVGFYIPWERLKEGPAGQVDDGEEWEISEVRIPSQVKAGFVDVWSLGRRRCPVGFRLRFLRCDRV